MDYIEIAEAAFRILPAFKGRMRKRMAVQRIFKDRHVGGDWSAHYPKVRKELEKLVKKKGVKNERNGDSTNVPRVRKHIIFDALRTIRERNGDK